MSKPEIPLKGGDEQDMLTPWRKYLKCAERPGVPKKAKRSYNKRVRKEALSEVEDWDQDDWNYFFHRTQR